MRSVNTKELVAGLVAAKSRTHGHTEEQVAGSSRRDKSQLSGREEKLVWFLRGRLLFHLLTGTCNTNKAHEGTSTTSPRATSGANSNQFEVLREVARRTVQSQDYLDGKGEHLAFNK